MTLTKYVLACLLALPPLSAAYADVVTPFSCANTLVGRPEIELLFLGDPLPTEQRLVLTRAAREVASWLVGLNVPKTVRVMVSRDIGPFAGSAGVDALVISTRDFEHVGLPIFLHELGHLILMENLPGDFMFGGTIAELGRRTLAAHQALAKIEAEYGPRFFTDMLEQSQDPAFLAKMEVWERARLAKSLASASFANVIADHLPIAEVFADLLPVLYAGELGVMQTCIGRASVELSPFRNFCETHVPPLDSKDEHILLYRVRFEIGAILRAHPGLPKRALVNKILRALKIGLAQATRSTATDHAPLYVRELRKEFR